MGVEGFKGFQGSHQPHDTWFIRQVHRVPAIPPSVGDDQDRYRLREHIHTYTDVCMDKYMYRYIVCIRIDVYLHIYICM